MGDEIIELTDEKFKNEVESSKIPVMVDFWASWCGPCKMMAPIVEGVAGKYKGRLKVAKVNVDENQVVASQLSIMNIPTFVFFKNGKETLRFSGAVSEKELIKNIEKALNV